MNYEELLEKARKTYESEDTPHVVKAWLLANIIYPADESEDERIRKALIELVKYAKGNCLELLHKPFNVVSMDAMLAWLEKQGEQPTDKVESYFKVGDWVILNGVVAKILDKQKYGFVGLDIDGKDFFCNYGHTDSMRLWSIEDAKDGDMLVNSKDNPFIFTGKFTTNYHNPIAYCGIGNEDKFIVCALNWRFHWAEKKEVSPATKEQRDLLFQKMREAGYEWDGEKKELKKIEVASKESEDERIRKGIIRNLQYLMDRSEGFVKEDLQERIAWLEKQESVGEIVERCKTSWYNEGKIDGQIEGLSDDEKYQQGWHDALEKQGKQKQSWKPSIAQKIVIKELIEDKNTSNVHKTILRGMLDEFKQFTNNYKRETDNYEVEDSSQT